MPAQVVTCGDVRRVHMCRRREFWACLWARINSTVSGDHSLHVSENSHVSFWLCWWHQHWHCAYLHTRKGGPQQCSKSALEPSQNAFRSSYLASRRNYECLNICRRQNLKKNISKNFQAKNRNFAFTTQRCHKVEKSHENLRKMHWGTHICTANALLNV